MTPAEPPADPASVPTVRAFLASRLPVWLSVAAFWSLLALVYATQIWWLARRPGERFNVWAALVWQCAFYLTWTPFTLLVWRLTRGWLVETLGRLRFVLRHLALAVAIGAAHVVTYVAIALPISGERMGLPQMILNQMRGRLHLEILIYAAVAGVGLAIAMHERYRERQIAAARLEAQLAEARLEALRAHLQPHFLFNSLHSISSLAREGDNAGVVRLIAGFGDLLRRVLDTQTRTLPLSEELQLVERYLDMQRVRFADRLQTSIDVAPDVRSARVPPLVVQPLVENALRHGLAPLVGPGRVSIRATREQDWTVIQVEDTGVGLSESWTLAASNGTGLRNLASRLTAEFAGRHELAIERRPGGGVRARLRIPYQPA